MNRRRTILDINKPNGQYQLEANVNVILNFIRNLPIRKVRPDQLLDRFLPLLVRLRSKVSAKSPLYICNRSAFKR